MYNGRCEVLNISNINSHGDVVLNDQSLLELIRSYPFLYNNAVRPQDDKDYDDWAWQRITKDFNASYKNLELTEPYSANVLRKRWKVLVPTIRSLARAADTSEVPVTLRNLVKIIGTQINEEQVCLPPLGLSAHDQNRMMQNLQMLERLSLDDRKRFEAEFMEILLETELAAAGLNQPSDETLQKADKEYKDVIKKLELDQVLELHAQSPGANIERIRDVSKRINRSISKNDIKDNDSLSASPTRSPVANMERIRDVSKRISRSISKNDQKENGSLNASPTRSSATADRNIRSTNTGVLNKVIRKVPLHLAKQYVRPCKVRIKRVCMDDLPLATIRRVAVLP